LKIFSIRLSLNTVNDSGYVKWTYISMKAGTINHDLDVVQIN